MIIGDFMKILVSFLITYLALFQGGAFANDCSSDDLQKLSRKNTHVRICNTILGLEDKKDQKYILIVRNEYKKQTGRGVGIEVYQKGKEKIKPLFQDYGLGQVLGSFYNDNKKVKLLIKDIDKNGQKEFGINVLNERTALFFLYHYDKKKKIFKPIQFNQKVNKKIQQLNRLVSTLDHPIKLQSDSIQVYFDDKNAIKFKFKNGAFHQE